MHESLAQKPFGAILVPTNRRVDSLSFCLGSASETRIPLIVLCSKRVNKDEAPWPPSRAVDLDVYAVDLTPLHPAAPPEGISLLTSTDEKLLAVTSGQTRDLSTKRNLGLLIAKMLGWERPKFLDDDIYGISKAEVDAPAAGLVHHNVSVLIPDEFPDNSVAATPTAWAAENRASSPAQASMGLRCDRDDLAFFPNIYNEDWFFFADEAANRQIIQVGYLAAEGVLAVCGSERAVKEEFGDLRWPRACTGVLKRGWEIPSVDAAFWDKFIESRGPSLKGSPIRWTGIRNANWPVTWPRCPRCSGLD